MQNRGNFSNLKRTSGLTFSQLSGERSHARAPMKCLRRQTGLGGTQGEQAPDQRRCSCCPGGRATPAQPPCGPERVSPRFTSPAAGQVRHRLWAPAMGRRRPTGHGSWQSRGGGGGGHTCPGQFTFTPEAKFTPTGGFQRAPAAREAGQIPNVRWRPCRPQGRARVPHPGAVALDGSSGRRRPSHSMTLPCGPGLGGEGETGACQDL